MKADPARFLTIPQAGREYFGLGPNSSYAAANRGQIPFIRIGRRHLVPRVAMDKLLTECGGVKPTQQRDQAVTTAA
jgi:hypothetical protein